MFQKLRRQTRNRRDKKTNSFDSTTRAKPAMAVDSDDRRMSATSGPLRRVLTANSKTASTPGTSFLSLPGEIRNAIYVLAAKQTTLRLHVQRKKSNVTGVFVASDNIVSTPPGLLLACKRTRIEYLPLLLAHARIWAIVDNFDFHGVQRLADSLYSTERRALRENNRMTLRLAVPRKNGCNTNMLASLRRWLVYRSGTGAGAGSLPWSYALCWTGEEKMGRFREAVHEEREVRLRSTIDRMHEWCGSLDETLWWELKPIVQLFGRELQSLPGGLCIPWAI